MARFVKEKVDNFRDFVSWDEIGGLSSEATKVEDLNIRMGTKDQGIFSNLPPDAFRDLNGWRYHHVS